MRMYDLILKKKEGAALSKEEIQWMINAFTTGEIPDYQMSAMLMAICFQGMNHDETLALTLAMRDSGDVLDLSGIKGVKVDKHSTGGVGDKTSLILTPIIAALGVPVAKMSGRGLGHTGGTIDKLECFEGFSTSISEEAFLKQVSEVGVAIAGQTANLAPADKKLYALRDVTATVAEKSLIASSIMSKKLASGSDAIVLDVKTGNGAFMQTVEKAEELARIMVAIGNGAGKKTYAVITDMSQPLGNTVGNIVEVQEAIEALNGKGPKDLMDVVYAYFVEAQGGRKEQVYHPQLLAKAAITETITAPEDGYVEALNAMAIGTACMSLGGGRETKESQIDLTAGIRLKKKIGDSVKKGECLAELYGNDAAKCNDAKELVQNAFLFSKEPLDAPETVLKYITA